MSVVNTVPQPTSDNYTFREEYTQIIDKKIEILAAACLFAAGVYFAGVCSIGFSCCILLAGSFPCIAELGIEAIHGHEPISVAAAPIPTPVEEVPILSPEEIESRIESARASLETTLENEVLTPQLINDKLTFWIQLPGAREYLSNLDRMNVSNERQALHFKTWLTSHSSEIRELELQLPNNVQLPREIGLLTNLQFLSIAGGGQQLPDEIALLRNLRGLRFRDSILTQVPQQIQLLRNLTSLSLYIDNLSIIPEYLFDFGNLRAIELSGLFSEIPLGILRLTNLTTL
ncbi:MAG: leucine-rich repeat domain-containing protein, partial [Simkaniaceae bacterium]|nr:leucine-rich repeat domain-containing protein [Simkaniaceae bacterium]